MDIASKRRPAYDPQNLHPLDEEDRKHDDLSAGIDWDEIIASTQDDVEAGIYAFDSTQYPTEEMAMAALKQFIHEAVEEGCREAAAAHTVHA